ncbi:mitochondrial protein FMP14 [Zygosaccharomyces mellis]|uniref:Mitochondrial protein FMP14 n=1 Tax=Zygosaccharomyces mellis TaxID=42258 RepID=A0A4C2EH08_9SACH|nr:mitochondrial protein FMP14 [Zygosaccharomyces mellis]
MLKVLPTSFKTISTRSAFRIYQISPLTSYSPLKSSQHADIKSLEDLTKLKSLESVDPELIRKLINERTVELNVQNELEMLKNLNRQEKMSQEVSLKRFIRPLWVFFLMSSTVYLILHYIWWKLEVIEKEKELRSYVESLEMELDQTLESQNRSTVGSQSNGNNKIHDKPWYRRWF